MFKKNNRRLMSLMLVLIMITTLIPSSVFASEGAEDASDAVENAAAVWDGSINTDWYTNHENDASYTLSTAEELAGLAQLVNDGTSFKGKTITLGANIDLGGKEWTPIGTKEKLFIGTFDGNGKTVSNLKITRGLENTTKNNCIGFFGASTSSANIQNFTLNNVNVSGSLQVAAVLGGSGVAEAKIDNVHVTGNVQISGWWYVGGIMGKGYSTITNCSVEGDGTATSAVAITGAYAGGIVGFMGEDNCQTTSCTVKNITISGAYNGIGGINGILHYGNTIEDCTADNVVVWQTTFPEESDNGRIYCGAFAGTYLDNGGKTPPTLKDCTFTGELYNGTSKTDILESTRYVGSLWYGAEPPATVNIENCVINMPPVAQIGSEQYATLNKAVENASDGDTIVILRNTAIDNALDIEKNIEIDGNGHTITANGCAGLYIKKDLTALNIHDVTITGAGAGESVSESMSGEPFMGLGTYNGCYGVADLQLSNVTIEGFTYGLYFGKNPSGTTGTFNENPVTITAKNLIVKNNYVKGLYAEKLTDSSFEGCQFIDNGSDANKVASSNLKTWMSGVDINLKNGSYQNISFTNCTFTGNGQNNGTALHIKARCDGNYGADTRLSGVTVSGCTFTDNNAASGPIVLGEPGKGNLSPVNVNLQNNVTVTNNVADTISITYDANEGQNAIVTTIIAKDGSITNLPTPTRDGHTFSGWFTEKNGGNKVTTETTFAENTILYAHWGENTDNGDDNNGNNNGGGGNVTPKPDKPGDNNDNDNTNNTVTNPDGSTTTTITKEDGSSSTTTVGTDGKVEADVTLTEEAVNNADGGAVALPMPELSVTTDKSEAPTVTVNLPSKDTTKVEVPVKDVIPGTVAILVHPDGTEEVIKDTVTSAGGITVALSDGATIKVVDNSKSFSDVSANHWGASAIDFATSRELFAGTGANEFSPEGQMTRAMIWSVLARYEGADTPGGTGSEWYAGPQQWAIDNGISDGTMANSAMTREQLAAMLYRYVGSPAVSGTVGDFADASSVSSWASDAMVWAVQQGLIAGMDDGTLNPQGTATRTQVAAIFQRFIENKMA